MGVMVEARYDLSSQLLSFDFYGWLVQVAAAGAKEIVFGIHDGMDWVRYQSILQPGPALLGLPHREGAGGCNIASSRFRHLVLFAAENSFPRLHTVLPPASYRYTVTIRYLPKASYRNSNEQTWRDFAKEIGAVVIEDWTVKPIHLHERMALYAGAKMNFGVVCGPLSMCSLSPYPCVQFKFGHCWGNGFYEKAGLRWGMKMPWHLPNQYAIWEQDDPDTIRSWFKQWKS